MTELFPDRRFSPPASASASASELTIRGLMHDLGHQMMTLSLLMDSVRDDNALSAESRRRMDVVMQEMFRIVDVIADSIPARPRLASPSAVDMRALASDVAYVAALAYDTTIVVEPGAPAFIPIGASVLWRVLGNLVDNAVRAVGPGGRVDIRIHRDVDTVLEIADDGPGFGGDPPHVAGLGLTVVRHLLASAGGRLDVSNGTGGGGRVRVTFAQH